MARQMAFKHVKLEIISAIFVTDEDSAEKKGLFTEFFYKEELFESDRVDCVEGTVTWNQTFVLQSFQEVVESELTITVRDQDEAEVGQTVPMPLFEPLVNIIDERVEDRNTFQQEIPLIAYDNEIGKLTLGFTPCSQDEQAEIDVEIRKAKFEEEKKQ